MPFYTGKFGETGGGGGRGEGGTRQSFLREAPSRGQNPFPLIYHFDRKGTPFVYLS